MIIDKTFEILEVKEQIRKFIAETAYVPVEQVKDNTMIFEEGIFDSMGFLSLINFIEEHFRIAAEDTELLEDNFASVSAISMFIEKKLRLN